MLSIFASAQTDNVSKTMNPGEDVTVNVKFDRIRLSQKDLAAQEQLNSLLSNSANTTAVLSESINRLTSAVEQGITQSTLTKADIVSNQLNISKDVLNRAFKRNNTIKLVSLIPALMFMFYALGSFLLQKGLDIKRLTSGTAIMTLYAIIGSGVMYATLSLLINKQYFVIKDLMSVLF